jgi:hypothetical protein
MRLNLTNLRIDSTDAKELDAARDAAIDFYKKAHLGQISLEVEWEIEDKFNVYIKEISDAFQK